MEFYPVILKGNIFLISTESHTHVEMPVGKNSSTVRFLATIEPTPLALPVQCSLHGVTVVAGKGMRFFFAF